MITVSLDYLDRRVFRKRETEIIFPDKTSLLVSDKFSVELFKKLEFDYTHQSSYKSIFFSSNKFLYVLDDGDFEVSVQQKGGFFNLTNWEELHNKTTEHIFLNKCANHFTRADLAFTTDEDWFSLVKKIDFKNLLVKTYSRKEELETIYAENSRISLVFYNKTKSLSKIRNQDYIKTFKDKFPQKQVFRLEVRLKGKDTLENVPSLLDEKINLKKVAAEIFQALEKRTVLPKKLKHKLKEAIDEIK